MTSSVNTRPFRILRRLRGIETQHVGQDAVGIDRGDSLFAGVVPGVAHQVDETGSVQRFSIVDRVRWRCIPLLFSSVLKKLLTRGDRPIDMDELAVATQAATSPDADVGIRAEQACRKLEYRRKPHWPWCCGIRSRSRGGLAAEVRCGEIPPTRGVEQVLDAVRSRKRRRHCERQRKT